MLKSVINEDNVKAVRKLLEESERIVITCHKSPDGDAIGSAFGLAHTLANIGKEAKVVTPDRPPRNLRFLPGVKEVVPYTVYPRFRTSTPAGCRFGVLSRLQRTLPRRPHARRIGGITC